MNYEEKYNEALERARKLYNDAKANEYKSDMEDYESIFPELADSEDERIRKEIISALKFANDGGVYDKHIAYLEKQKEQIPYTDFVIKPHKGDDNNPYDMQVSEAQEYAIKRGFGIPFNDGEVYVDERHMTQTIGNILRWADEHPKEQKPAESISQLTVQGKGVYKICPRCKERMVRDDSMVYTSMPPQYRYECPKCGESECDTVMYDNPKMEEQKPNYCHYGGDPSVERCKYCSAACSARLTDEQKPADLYEMMVHKEPYIAPVPTPMVADEQKSAECNEDTQLLAGDYAISHYEQDKTYSASEVHKMLADAFIAGLNGRPDII